MLTRSRRRLETIDERPKLRRSRSVPSSIAMQNVRVNLDQSFVRNYLRNQEKVDDELNISTISLHSDASDDPDKSVQFVVEEKATREIQQIGKMNERMAALKLRCTKLELHVAALQKRIIQQDNVESSENSLTNATDSVDATHEISTETNENAGAIDSFGDLQLSDSFVNNQLKEWEHNGQLTEVLDEFKVYLNDNVTNSLE